MNPTKPRRLYVPVEKLEDCILNLNCNGYRVISSQINELDEKLIKLFYIKSGKIDIDLAMSSYTAKKFMLSQKPRR
jgi:hypothetical protein